MKNLIIIGARGFGREVYNWALQCDAYKKEWMIKGFLDDDSKALDGFSDYHISVLSVEDYKIVQDDVFICALGDVQERKKYASMILKKGGEFINLIRPMVIIDSVNVKLGKGIIISSFCGLGNDSAIGDFVIIQAFSALGHDITIGDYCQVNAYTHIGGYCNIGENVTINPGAIILPKITIGDNATIGAGSVVLKNVKSNVTVFGNPAKEIF
jgi:sugar O-acyltransferase (sialic acid O-acetyltransferase NeuD family)